MSLEQLTKVNEELKAELARLQALEQSLADDGKQEQKSREVVDGVKKAFDRFDKDHSGFIDKKELQGLSSELGELLDEEELQAAMKAIDVSGDGKISFNEFIRWWTNPDRQVTEKDFVKLLQLRGKLSAEYLSQAVPKIVRQLSGLKLTNDNPKEWLSHRIAFAFAEAKEPKSALRVKVGFDKLDKKDIPGGNAVLVKFVAKLNKDYNKDELKELQQKFEEKAKGKGNGDEISFAVDEKSGTWTLKLGKAGPDPLAITEQINLDLAQFIKEFSFIIELANGIDAVLDENVAKDKTLVELLGLKTELKLQVRKAMFETIATTLPLPKIVELFWATFLESLNISFEFGDIKQFVDAAKPTPESERKLQEFFQQGGMMNNPMLAMMPQNPANAAVAQMQNQMLMQFLMGANQAIKMLTVPEAIGNLREMINAQGFPVKTDDAVKGFTLIKKVFSEVTEITFHTTSGVRVTAAMDNFLPVRLMPNPVKKETAVVRRGHRAAMGHRGKAN